MPVAAVADGRWLDLVMNYQAQISRRTVDVDALHSGDFGILLAPHTADTFVADAAAGRVNDAVCHEKVHATQPRVAKGKILSNDHHLLELQLLEGVTQAITNDLSAGLHDRPRHGLTGPQQTSGAYLPWVAVVDAAAELSGDARAFRAELNRTPKNSRTALIARTFTGADDTRAQQAVIRALLPVTKAAEQQFEKPNIARWAGEQATRALSELQLDLLAAA